MTEPRDFEVKVEVAQFVELLPYDIAAEADLVASRRAEEAASQNFVLDALSEAGDPAAEYLRRFLAANAEYDLDDCLQAIRAQVDTYGPSSDVDPADLVALYRLRSLEERVTAARAIVDEYNIFLLGGTSDATDRKRSLQAIIYTSSHLTDEQKLRYATVADQMLPGEGMSSDAPEVVEYAHRADEEYDAARWGADLRGRMKAALVDIYTARGVPAHDDIDRFGGALRNYVIDEDSRHGPLLYRIVRHVAANMGIDDATLELVIDDLRRVRDSF